MNHEAMPHSEHVVNNKKFWHQIIPEIRIPAMRTLGHMLEGGTLRQASASVALRELWNFTDEVFVNRPRNWPSQAKAD